MFTNKTANLDLPQWVGSDKANWDIDLNYAFKQISDYVSTLNEKFSGLDSTDGQFDASIKEINKNIETINTAIDSINEVDGIQSADITDLKEKVTKLQTDVSDLTTSSTDLTQRIQTIENDLPTIQQSITTLTQNYNELNTKVTSLTAKVNTATYFLTSFKAKSGENKITDETPTHVFLIIPDYRRVRVTTEDIITSVNLPIVCSVGNEFTPAKKEIGTIKGNIVGTGEVTLTVYAQFDVGSGGVYSNFRFYIESENTLDADLSFTVLKI